jgi:hypothetical protein
MVSWSSILPSTSRARTYSFQSKQAQSPPRLARSKPSACARLFAIPELCEQVLQHVAASMGELFLLRRVCRTWKALVEGTPLLKRHTLLLLANGKYQPGEYWGYPNGLNNLIFDDRLSEDMSISRDPYLMFMYHEDKPDTTYSQQPRADLLEQLEPLKDTMWSHMFLTQPPVSVVRATWKFGRRYMDMEMSNDVGVRVSDLIEHLQEFGRMPDGGKMVGMELTALFVWCVRMQRPKNRGRGGWKKNRKRPSWHEKWAVDDDDEHVALDN